ncbi:MAG: hypothetical protein ACJ76J_03635, partial [Thermoanaerobaculia bacterium]
RIELSRPADGLVTSEPELTFAGSLGEPASLSLNGSPVAVDGQAFLHGPVLLQEGTNAFLLIATDRAGNVGELALTVTLRTAPPDDSLPPDPRDVATPIDPTVASDLAADMEFLYTGSHPIQTGVEPGTIEPRRAAVVRGRVIGRDGGPLSGARISILGHPELGSTLSRADGMFDLAVNGGGALILHYEKEGRLAVQRQVDVAWRDFAWAPDVALIPYDSPATVVVAGSPEIQVARGSMVQDEDGSRRSTLLIPAGTGAEMVLPDGSVQALPSLTLRATEYTVGPNGPEAMPGPLPPTVAYTYAVELSADEAVAAGAERVSFTQPLIHYVENFLGFPVGGAVPSGYYDRERAAWVPSDNGRIVRVLGIAGGLADLDVTGSGMPADGPALAALGITEAELRQLALLYVAGQSLWRVPIPHLTPWDHNWPYGPPDDATLPEETEPETDEPEDESCEQGGSVIDCHNQVLGEDVPVTGTPFQLHYRSDRVPGRVASRTLKIPLSGASVPASLKRIEVEIRIAGRRFTETFPAAPDLDYSFAWDGKDAYGRTIQGRVVATLDLGWVYEGVYREPGTRFASFGGTSTIADRTRQEVTLRRRTAAVLGSWSARELGLGGWSLTVHHGYDPNSRTLFYGDGRRLSRRSLDLVRKIVAGGNPYDRTAGEGLPAVSVNVNLARGVVAAPDGSFYFAERDGQRVRHVDTQGIVRTVAGTWGAGGFGGDGGLATQALLNGPVDVDLGPDGSLYIAEWYSGCIRRVDRSGVIRTVAGRGFLQGEGIPATQALLTSVSQVLVAPDGTFYFSDTDGSRVRRVDRDGLVWTVAGTGTAGFSGDGGPANRAQLYWPWGLALDRDGNLYISDSGNKRIRRVGPDGTIRTVAGGGTTSTSKFREGMAATEIRNVTVTAMAAAPDGSLIFFATDGGLSRLLRLSPEGLLTSLEGKAFLPSLPSQMTGLALAPGGEILLTADSEIWGFAPLLPGAGAGGSVVPSEDGRELFVFDVRGRHLRTVDGLTGDLRYQFSYDARGLLSEIADASGNATRIERFGNGNPAAVVAPFGDRTALAVDAEGYLARITNPLGEAFSYASSADGLLLSQTDPKGRVSLFRYDEGGRLVRDDDPAGGFKSLTRLARLDGYAVEVRTALGRRTSYAVDRPDSRDVIRVNTLPSGVAYQTTSSPGGRHVSLQPDGTTVTVFEGEDPRFKSLVPVSETEQVRTPSGLISTRYRFRTALLADPANPASLTRATESLIDNGRTSTLVYDGLLRRMTLTSAESRQRSLGLDALGRISSVALTGLQPVAFTYDARGRLSALAQGSGEEQRLFQLSYGDDGRLATVTDPLSRTVAFQYDEAGRVSTQTLPDSQAIALAHDPLGNVA